jgi:hypothetical protein
MTSRLSGQKKILHPSATYSAIDTWIECPNTINLKTNADQLRVFFLVATGDPGIVTVKLQVPSVAYPHTYCDLLGPGREWSTEDLNETPCQSMPLNGAGLIAHDEVKVWFKASKGASSAEIEIQGEAYESSSIWSGPRVEKNGGSPVNVQDQATPPIDALFSQSISNFTISADAVASGITTLNHTFTATAGHGIIVGDEIILLDTEAGRALQATVVAVAVNDITIDRPIDHSFAAADTLGRIVTSQMAVVGSLVAPQIFSIRAGDNPSDLTRFLITMLDDASMDDGRFGGLPALTNGLVLRIVNGFQKTMLNFKTNGDIKQFCYDLNYASRAPSGQFGLSARITYAGQDKHGVVLRIATGDVVQWVVQDDISALLSMRISAQGHDTTT